MARTAGSKPTRKFPRTAAPNDEVEGVRSLGTVDTGITGPEDPESTTPTDDELRSLGPNRRELTAMGGGFIYAEKYIVNLDTQRIHRKKGLTENCNTDQIKNKRTVTGKVLNEDEQYEDYDTCDWCH